MVSGVYLQLSDDDSTSIPNLERKREERKTLGNEGGSYMPRRRAWLLRWLNKVQQL